MRIWALVVSAYCLAGCAVLPTGSEGVSGATVSASETRRAPEAPPPPPDARSVEEFDTTSAAQRAAALAQSGVGRSLGRDIVTLGDPARPGFWVETALVDVETPGRIALTNDAEGVEVTLFPGTGGGRISLAALRLLEVPLTELVEVELYATE